MRIGAVASRLCSPLQVWIDPSTGIGTPYVHALEAALGNSSVVVTALLLIFAVAHSGGAYLRPYGTFDKALGPRALAVSDKYIVI